jgi:hypothetical protein
VTGTRTTIGSDPGAGTTRTLATPPRSIVARATTRIRATRRTLRATTPLAAAVGSRRIAEGAGEGGAGQGGDLGGATEEEAIEAIGTPTGGTDESSRATRFPTSFTAFIIARK